jgi:uncharacterized protein (TIGR04255 family)
LERSYGKSPLVEAICEFKFHSDVSWDWTIPGLMFGEIKEEFPKKSEVKRLGVEFKPFEKGFDSRMSQGIERLRFSSTDEKKLIQIGENILAVNQLKPYINWNDFKEKILYALNCYQSIATPTGMTRLGLRYINHITTIPGSPKIEDYFYYYPKFPNPDQVIIGELFLRSTLPMPNQEELDGYLNLILAIKYRKTSEAPIFILDLDMIYDWEEETPLNVDEAEEYIERAHDYVIDAFESCITEKLRNTFDLGG